MINIVIADDQVLLRKSLGQIISVDPEMNVCAMVGTGKQAVDACRNYQPNIVLMDIEMPSVDGIAALKMIKQLSMNSKVIMLTTFGKKEYIIDSFLSGADGFVTKDIDCVELIAVIKCVNYGQIVIHQSVREIMVDKFKKTGIGKRDYVEILSPEEIEMTRLIVAGKSNKDLAQTFNYTEGTIKNKVSRIYEKLEISDRLQLAVYAVENGIDT